MLWVCPSRGAAHWPVAVVVMAWLIGAVGLSPLVIKGRGFSVGDPGVCSSSGIVYIVLGVLQKPTVQTGVWSTLGVLSQRRSSNKERCLADFLLK